jgi:hypothetical protein
MTSIGVILIKMLKFKMKIMNLLFYEVKFIVYDFSDNPVPSRRTIYFVRVRQITRRGDNYANTCPIQTCSSRYEYYFILFYSISFQNFENVTFNSLFKKNLHS